MARTISAPVGKDSAGRLAANRPQDVVTVQELLNEVPLLDGGPTHRLTITGILDQQTFLAICKFQQRKFGWADGLVEPNERTLRELNKFASEPVDVTPLISMHITGERQQQFLGDRHLEAGEMELIAFWLAPIFPPESRTGGQLQREPPRGELKQISVVKLIGPSAAQLFLAAATGESLTVTITQMKRDKDARIPVVRYTLSEASVTALKTRPDYESQDHTPAQEITFSFEKIFIETLRSDDLRDFFLNLPHSPTGHLFSLLALTARFACFHGGHVRAKLHPIALAKVDPETHIEIDVSRPQRLSRRRYASPELHLHL